MDLAYLRGALIRTISAVLCAGVFYSVWLGAFLLTAGQGSAAMEAVLWLLAPVVTAAGFTTGSVIRGYRSGTDRTTFRRVFVWPLAGCVIGAGAVYWFGPMLIVFGMLAAGTLSVVLREAVEFFDGRRR